MTAAFIRTGMVSAPLCRAVRLETVQRFRVLSKRVTPQGGPEAGIRWLCGSAAERLSVVGN